MDIKVRYKDQRIETFHNMTNLKIGVNWIHFDSDEGFKSINKNEMMDYTYVETETTDLESKESNQFLYAVMIVVALLSILVYFLF
jgi:hypothetical protein